VAEPRNDDLPVISYHSLEMRRNVPYRNKRKAGRVIISHRMPRTAANAGKPNANQAQKGLRPSAPTKRSRLTIWSSEP
jgi:hypothetical protein